MTIAECWTTHANTNVERGQLNSASTVADCQAACIANTSCTGIDFVHGNQANSRCWLTGPWSGARNNGTRPGVTHYDLNRDCQGELLCYTILRLCVCLCVCPQSYLRKRTLSLLCRCNRPTCTLCMILTVFMDDVKCSNNGQHKST